VRPGRRRVPRDRARLRVRGRLRPMARPEPGALQRRRRDEHDGGHHHRPRRRSSGRDGVRVRWQHRHRARDVRTGARKCAEVRGQEPGESVRDLLRRRADVALARGSAQRRSAPRTGGPTRADSGQNPRGRTDSNLRPGRNSNDERSGRRCDRCDTRRGAMSGRAVAVVGGITTKFGVRPTTWAELAQEVGAAVFRAVPELRTEDVDSLFVGAAEPERFAFQSHVAPLAAEQMGLQPYRILQRTELACASGQSAIRSAYAAIASGLSDVAVAVGIEKMNLPSMAEANSAMACVMDRAWDGPHGATAPPFFAMVAQRHMLEYGTTEEQLAAVSEKNHRF